MLHDVFPPPLMALLQLARRMIIIHLPKTILIVLFYSTVQELSFLGFITATYLLLVLAFPIMFHGTRLLLMLWMEVR